MEALGELVDLTTEEALKPFVVQITGPLIRIVGDRFPSQIKAAILVTLGRLIAKAGAGLKPFVPQLQTTFLKCLSDTAPGVRSAAAANLGELTRLSARLDQLTSDLASNAANATEMETRVAYLQALKGALLASGDKLQPATLGKVISFTGDASERKAGHRLFHRLFPAGVPSTAICRVASSAHVHTLHHTGGRQLGGGHAGGSSAA